MGCPTEPRSGGERLQGRGNSSQRPALGVGLWESKNMSRNAASPGGSAAPLPTRDDAESSLALVGTSGFSYSDWKGSFYPEWLPARDQFHYYATQFDSVELNVTFYRPPLRSTLERWKSSAPPGYPFVLKASKEITHVRRL